MMMHDMLRIENVLKTQVEHFFSPFNCLMKVNITVPLLYLKHQAEINQDCLFELETFRHAQPKVPFKKL